MSVSSRRAMLSPSPDITKGRGRRARPSARRPVSDIPRPRASAQDPGARKIPAGGVADPLWYHNTNYAVTAPRFPARIGGNGAFSNKRLRPTPAAAGTRPRSVTAAAFSDYRMHRRMDAVLLEHHNRVMHMNTRHDPVQFRDMGRYRMIPAMHVIYDFTNVVEEIRFASRPPSVPPHVGAVDIFDHIEAAIAQKWEKDPQAGPHMRHQMTAVVENDINPAEFFDHGTQKFRVFL